LVDRVFASVQLFVLVLEIDEPASESFNAKGIVLINVLVVGDHFLQEVGVLAKIDQLFLPVIKFVFLLVDRLSQRFDCLLVF